MPAARRGISGFNENLHLGQSNRVTRKTSGRRLRLWALPRPPGLPYSYMKHSPKPSVKPTKARLPLDLESATLEH